jgi:4-amino-4-deoxy-L-arabinose transferase-like glycosyltransferase
VSSVTSYAHRRPQTAIGLAWARTHAAGLAVAALTAAAFVLRLSQIHQTLVGDEMLAYGEVFAHTLGQTLHLVHTGVESSPPLFFVLAWLSIKLGDPTVWIRLPSLVLGTATVPLVFLLGRQTVGRVAGVIGASAVALGPFAVYYGIEARPYATMTFFVALSTLALLRAIDTRRPVWWVVYSLSAAAAAYSHYTCVFVLAVQAAWSVWVCREHPRPPLLAAGAIVLLYLPWLPNLQGKDLNAYQQLYPLSLGRVLSDLLRPLPGHPSAPLRAIPTLAGLAVFATAVVGGAAALTRQVRLRPRPAHRLLLLIGLAVATPAGVLLYSLIVKDIWLPRDLAASLPAIALLSGALLAALPRPAAAVAAVAVLGVLLVGTLRSFEPAYARGPYRSIAAYLDRVAGPRDPVTIVSWLGRPAIPAEFKRPHLLMRAASQWHTAPGAGAAYIVLDLTIDRLLKIGTPRQAGYRLVARKHYTGAFATDVLTYRPG